MSMNNIDIDRQIACVRRECRMRQHVYPRWVDTGKMTQKDATDELFAMAAVLATLERVRDAERPKLI